MKSEAKNRHNLLSEIFNFLFYIIYLIINFFVSIGEVASIIFIKPFVVCYRLFGHVFSDISGYLPKPKPINLYLWRKKGERAIPMLINFLFSIFFNLFIKIGDIIIFLTGLVVKPFKLISLKTKYFILGFFMCLAVVFLYSTYDFVRNLPSPTNIGKFNYPLSTHMYDRKDRLLYEIYREQNRTPIKLANLPNYIYQTTIAIEDKEFYKHSGISIGSGVLRALKEMLLHHKLQGGSTITQQLVKSALLTPERTIDRKIKEIVLALWTERLYTKDQILEMYLNQVPYGGSAYGIEEASKIYFNKNAKDLSLAEAAFLAGLPQSPTAYSPYTDPRLAVSRRNNVLQAMYEANYIDKKTKEQTEQETLNVIAPSTTIKAPHFVFYVKNELEKQYGIKQIEEGGFKVTTSLDLDVQKKAEEILKEELEKISSLNVTNGAILVTRPETGEILAMVGSVDYFKQPSGAFNVTTALRQPGSSIKPLMYSLALQKKYTAASVIDDSPVSFNVLGSSSYRPVNYDGRFHGRVTLRYALANSYNIPAVKVLNSLGVEEFIKYAKKMGINSWDNPSDYGLSLTLGGGEVRIVDMAAAFGVFANEGERVDLTGIDSINNYAGNSIYRLSPNKNKVIDQGIAYIISDILSDNVARQQAFGPKSFLEIPGYRVAVKTGTTDNKKDNWTIGYTPDYLVAVWVGNNDNTPMNPYLASGITGAAPIWNRVMTYLLENYSGKKNWFAKPDDIVEKQCFFNSVEYFIKGTEVNVGCHQSLLGPSVTPSPSP